MKEDRDYRRVKVLFLETAAKKPGQWPPLPPKGYRGGATSAGAVGSTGDVMSELPPPPKPPKDWNATGIRLPPRPGRFQPN